MQTGQNGGNGNSRDVLLRQWESELSDVKEDVAGLKTGMDGVRATLVRLDASITSLAQSMASSYRPQWGAMAAWASVMIGIGSIVVSGILYQIIEVKGDIKDTNDRSVNNLVAIARLDERNLALSGRVERNHETINQSVKDLDTMIQRETRLLDNQLRSEVEGFNAVNGRRLDELGTSVQRLETRLYQRRDDIGGKVP